MAPPVSVHPQVNPNHSGLIECRIPAPNMRVFLQYTPGGLKMRTIFCGVVHGTASFGDPVSVPKVINITTLTFKCCPSKHSTLAIDISKPPITSKVSGWRESKEFQSARRTRANKIPTLGFAKVYLALQSTVDAG